MSERRRRQPQRRLLVPITLRVLSVNVLALVALVAGTLSIAEYRDRLIANQSDLLLTQAQIIAQGLTADIDRAAAAVGELVLSPQSQHALQLMADQTGARARIYDRNGELVADSRRKAGAGLTEVWTSDLPPPQSATERGGRILNTVFTRLIDALSDRPQPLPFDDQALTSAADFEEVRTALAGQPVSAVRRVPLRVAPLALGDLDRLEHAGDLVICAAAPFRRTDVLGAVFLTRNSIEVDQAAWRARYDALEIFLFILVPAVALSFFLAQTIARPLRQLAVAARRVRGSRGLDQPMPTFPRRRDEIGELAEALADMTEALRSRIDAIERFAADVSHEIKNPLGSIRSALETARRLDDRERQAEMLAIIESDVHRIDRLIRDISEASRLDTDLSRLRAEPVDIAEMLRVLMEITAAPAEERQITLTLSLPESDALVVLGHEGRLMQVFRNILTNALSFSACGAEIRITAGRNDEAILICIDDDGPGVPPGKESDIFARFYSARPPGEAFGQHSGLGLSISRQIVDAHFGTIDAENRPKPDGSIAGARFVVSLPAAN